MIKILELKKINFLMKYKNTEKTKKALFYYLIISNFYSNIYVKHD